VYLWLYFFATKALIFLDQREIQQKGLHENPLKKIAVKARPEGICPNYFNE
jgi:hypothetical protein